MGERLSKEQIRELAYQAGALAGTIFEQTRETRDTQALRSLQSGFDRIAPLVSDRSSLEELMAATKEDVARKKAELGVAEVQLTAMLIATGERDTYFNLSWGRVVQFKFGEKPELLTPNFYDSRRYVRQRID